MYEYFECIIFWRRKGKDSFGKKLRRNSLRMAIARNLLLAFAFLATCYLGSHLKGAKSQKPMANGRRDGLLAIALGYW